MRLDTLLASFSLLALSACGGSGDAGSIDKLIQDGDFTGAITACEAAIATAEKGSSEHKDLVISLSEALASVDAAKAKDTFIAFADSNGDALEPRDVKYVVNKIKAKDLLAAIGVMDKGKKLWPEDKTMDLLLETLKSDAANSGNAAANEALKGLGYM